MGTKETMNQQEAIEFVVSELGKQHQLNDIIKNLCDKTSMDWKQAESFVFDVASNNRSRIARKQSPLTMEKIVLSFGALRYVRDMDSKLIILGSIIYQGK